MRTAKPWFIWILAGILFIGCSLWDNDTPPDRLKGLWVSDHPRYEGCSLEIDKKYIVFNAVTGESFLHLIKDIDVKEENGLVMYDIEYTNRDDERLRIFLDYRQTADGEVLNFRHQKNILWKKRPDHRDNVGG